MYGLCSRSDVVPALRGHVGYGGMNLCGISVLVCKDVDAF